MLDLRKLRLLRELHARGTIAAVAEAVSFTPSAVSPPLSQLQRAAAAPDRGRAAAGGARRGAARSVGGGRGRPAGGGGERQRDGARGVAADAADLPGARGEPDPG